MADKATSFHFTISTFIEVKRCDSFLKTPMTRQKSSSDSSDSLHSLQLQVSLFYPTSCSRLTPSNSPSQPHTGIHSGGLHMGMREKGLLQLWFSTWGHYLLAWNFRHGSFRGSVWLPGKHCGSNDDGIRLKVRSAGYMKWCDIFRFISRETLARTRERSTRLPCLVWWIGHLCQSCW